MHEDTHAHLVNCIVNDALQVHITTNVQAIALLQCVNVITEL